VTIRGGNGNKARTVPLNTSARQALAEYLAPRLSCDPTVKAVAHSWPLRSPGSPSRPLWQSQKKGTLTTSVKLVDYCGKIRRIMLHKLQIAGQSTRFAPIACDTRAFTATTSCTRYVPFGVLFDSRWSVLSCSTISGICCISCFTMPSAITLGPSTYAAWTAVSMRFFIPSSRAFPNGKIDES
jgi:hypothetical protein